VISTTAPIHCRHPEAIGAEISHPVNTFRWLLILGFPVNIAAAQTMPELFTAGDANGAGDEDSILRARLQVTARKSALPVQPEARLKPRVQAARPARARPR
jgi:hypothetical protein